MRNLPNVIFNNESTATTGWNACRFLTCSVLPVRRACNCHCPFCFSKSSISALAKDSDCLGKVDVESFYRFSKERGATRLVITGGGEPLLRQERVLDLLRRARPFFPERTLFTNGTRLTPELAKALKNEGLSYICWSRHAASDDDNRALMGNSAPSIDSFIASCEEIPIRATCVMNRLGVSTRQDALNYMETLQAHGISEFTFKHTYVSYEDSVFGGSDENKWATKYQVQENPFEGMGVVEAKLPWGPEIKIINGARVCHYKEPTPTWELANRLARSTNLLSNGAVMASLEDRQSQLFSLPRLS